MAFFDKLAQRGIQRLGRTPRPLPGGIQSPQQIISQTKGVKPLTTTPATNRIGELPQRGQLGTQFQGGQVKQRFLADLPAAEQIEGINQILAGQDTNNESINQFVRTQAAQGKNPEQIRLAFIQSQQNSPNPLVIL